MRLTSRPSHDDADVIRARLRALLDDGVTGGGWVPGDDLDLRADPTDQPLLPATLVEGSWRSAAVAMEGDRAPVDEGAEGELPGGIGRHRAPGPAVRLDPGRRGAWSLWAAGLLGVVLLLLWTWSQRPQTHAVPQSAPSSASPSSPRTPPVGQAARTSATVVVSVVGRVARPGLVTLPTGARVADALAAAGGVLPDTDAAGVNLAAVVTDGQQISVGGPPASAAGTSAAAAAGAPARLDLNTATVADLDTLPGVGPVLAQRIVDYRAQHGRFASVDALTDVPGIGPALSARLADRVRV